MKQRSILISLLVIIALVIAACNGDDEDEVTEDETVLDPGYTITVSGEQEFTLEPENAEYRYDYEEPATAAGQDNMIESVNFGTYTMYFTGEDNEVRVIFSDAFEEGTHTVEANVPESDVVDPEPTRTLSATVAADGQDYILAQEGTLNIEVFDNDLITGSFEFVLGEGDGEITLEGEFENLAMESIPNEALDNEEEIPEEG